MDTHSKNTQDSRIVSQTAMVYILALTLSSMTLGKLLKFSMLQFLYLYNGARMILGHWV